MDDKFDRDLFFPGPLMAYNNSFGFNLGQRTGLINDFERGQRPSKYTRLSDYDINHAEQSLGRFNFDSVGQSDNPFAGRQWQIPLAQQQPQQPHQQQQQQQPNSAPFVVGSGRRTHSMNHSVNIIPLNQVDFSVPPPRYTPVSLSSNPLLLNAGRSTHCPANIGHSYAASISNDSVDNTEIYEGKSI